MLPTVPKSGPEAVCGPEVAKRAPEYNPKRTDGLSERLSDGAIGPLTDLSRALRASLLVACHRVQGIIVAQSLNGPMTQSIDGRMTQ